MPLLSSAELRQHQLVQTIRQNYADVGEGILAAFRTVPRHWFLHGLYERVPAEGVIWRSRSSREMTAEAWLQAVYEDRAYTIRLDASEQRFPASSSSQPSVMAAMFAALDIPAGSRVLSIGTGTGYTAALLAHLVGDPHLVTTVDLESDLIEGARTVIEQVAGKGMSIEARDGLQGVPERAPYDRIILTGAFPQVPQPLLEQLAPSGRLLMNVRRNLCSVMLLVEKDQDGAIGGRVLSLDAHFMLLHAAGTSPHERVAVPYEPLEPRLSRQASRLFVPSNLSHPDFGFFLQCHLPAARQLQYRQFLSLDDPATGRLLQFDGDDVCGDASLWHDLLTIAHRYQQLGLPKRRDFTFCVEAGQQFMQLNGQRWLFANVDSC